MSKYKNNPTLKSIVHSGDMDALAQEVRRMSKQLNQRYVRLERDGIAQQNISYRHSKAFLNVDEKPRFTENLNKIKRMDRTTLYETALELNRALQGATTQKEAKKVIEKRDKKSFEFAQSVIEKSETQLQEDLTKEKWKEFLENGGNLLLGAYDSGQIIEEFVEATKDNKVSVKQFLREYKRYVDFTSKEAIDKLKQLDFTKIQQNIENVATGNLKRRKKKK